MYVHKTLFGVCVKHIALWPLCAYITIVLLPVICALLHICACVIIVACCNCIIDTVHIAATNNCVGILSKHVHAHNKSLD